MTPEELYALWAPQDSVWSAWVLPVPFAQLLCPEVKVPAARPQFPLEWLPAEARDLAMVVDLPGSDAIRYGLALLDRGFRPIPVIDGSPGPDGDPLIPMHFSFLGGTVSKSAAIVDMRGLLLALCEGAAQLRESRVAPDAPPAFVLDSKRMTIFPPDAEGVFDNRWMAFPQDFPSSRFLLEHGIRRVVYVHDTFLTQPPEDLAHVLLRWQEDGITIESKSARFGDAPVPIQVNRPSRFRAVWYRALVVLGLRRNDAGGFGGYPPAASRTG